MKFFLEFLLAVFLKCALWFRYRITIKGLDKINPKTLNKPGGVLFLPNHPTVFVDATAITIALWPTYRIRPMIINYMYKLPIVNWVMRLLNALPVPDFSTSSNSLKRKMNEQVTQTIMEGLRHKENFLIFPSGKTKQTGYEAIDGASAVHRIIQDVPEVNVVLIRVKGLWGSSFSRALIGHSPPFFSTVFAGMKHVLKNLLFFTPRREVIVEFEPAPSDFPYTANRLEFNKYLERWYNTPDGLRPQSGPYPGDSLIFISYSMWREELPKLWNPGSVETTVNLSHISPEIQKKVLDKISELTGMAAPTIKPEMSLTTDLGMDSLDVAEIVAFLQDEFDVGGIAANDLTSVGKLMGIAAREVTGKGLDEEGELNTSLWKRPVEHRRVYIADGDTIPEVFLNNCNRMKDAIACADMTSGIVSYSQLKVRAIVLAHYIRTLPGDYVGILLPASVAASVTILACQIAGKIPLMINWTVGARHLQAVVELSQVKAVISSWSFIDRLQNVELDGVDEKLVMLEDIRQQISLVDKAKAFFLSKRNSKTIIERLSHKKISKDDTAVLLFTSGTESMPKGVPLTHENILSNQREALQSIEIFSDDILYSILPPFHSFGFTISSLLGLLSGVKTAYFPNPTDGPRLAKGFQKWSITLICGAPTFIKGMLKAVKPEQLETMRLCITGAEKLPKDLEQMMLDLGKAQCLMEGYGITECAPILTFTPVGKPRKGVGRPLPGVKLITVDLNNHTVLPTGEQGLILAQGPNVFSGYLNPGLSSPFITINGEKWYNTGDLGHLDPEGNLILSGRLKRFIKVGGEMVSLAAIEEALVHKALENAWIQPNEEGPSLAITGKEVEGEKPKIFLYCKFSIGLDDVNKALKEAGFSNLVKITSIIQLPELPIMGTGKTNYRKLEEISSAN